MKILINVTNQRLTGMQSLNNFVEGSNNFVQFVFNLDEQWQGLTTFAQFIQDGHTYNKYLDGQNSVTLPPEISEGTAILLLYGTGNGTIGTTNSLTLTINASNMISDIQSTAITPSLYEQLVNQVNALSEDVVHNEEFEALSGRVDHMSTHMTVVDEEGVIWFTGTDEYEGSVTGFNVDGTDHKYDYESLDNKPFSIDGDGTEGQVLRTNGDGTAEWADVGLPTDEQTATAISAWLTLHPEATTTVEDGSITAEKLHEDLIAELTPYVSGTTLYISGVHNNEEE